MQGNKGVLPYMIGSKCSLTAVPPAQRSPYNHLVDILRNIKTHPKPNDIDNGIVVLRAVKEFLECDPQCLLEELTRPLNQLSAALHDVKQGGKPAYFSAKEPRRERPANESDQARLGALAAGVEILRLHGMGKDEAAHFVVNECKKREISGVTAKDILNCRYDIHRSKASDLARQIYGDIMKGWKNRGEQMDAKAFVRGIIGSACNELPS